MKLLPRVLLLRLLKQLFPQWTRNALQLKLNDIETYRPPLVQELPPGVRVLALVPHPDDETIGCGGTLCKCIRAGLEVRVMILTDGRNGNVQIRELGDSDPDKRTRQRALVSTRQQETRDAMSRIGVKHVTFLDAEDGQLHAQTARVTEPIADIIRDWRPDTIILPFITDRHSDHSATSRCLIEACSDLDHACTRKIFCMGFETWSPLYANTLIDISDTMPTKLEAIHCYRSQLQGVNYASAIEGLNRYRALAGMTGGTYAEAYYSCELPEYERLCKQLLL